MRNKILILKTGKLDTDSYLESKLNNFAKNSIIEVKYFENIIISIPNIDDSEVKITIDGQPIDNYNLVYFKSWRKVQALATGISNYLDYKGIKFIDKAVNLPKHGNKISQYINLKINKLPFPYTVYMSRNLIKGNLAILAKSLSYPLIMKSAGASKGDNNFLLNNEEELIKTLDTLPERIDDLLFQEFIENTFDYRILVTGNHVGSVEKRIRKDNNTHLNNASKGAAEEFLPISELNDELKEIAVKAANVFDREIAGVDIVISSKNQNPYILEVNPSPGVTYDENETTEIKAIADYLDSLI